jgi:ABC-type uncharacterized transport system permease subunit
MTRLHRVLLQVEIGVCFAPLAINLMLGLLIAPFQVYFLFTAEPKARLGAFAAIALVAAGLCGLAALHSVMTWLLDGGRRPLQPRTVAIFAGIGMLLLLGLT